MLLAWLLADVIRDFLQICDMGEIGDIIGELVVDKLSCVCS